MTRKQLQSSPILVKLGKMIDLDLFNNGYFEVKFLNTNRVTYKGHSAKIIVLAPPRFIFFNWKFHNSQDATKQD